MKIVGLLISFILISSLLYLLLKPKNKINFQVINVASDTIFKNQIWHVNDTYGRLISVRAIGELDAFAEAYISDANHDTKFLLATLPKGKFDTTWRGEYYEPKAEIVFLHRKAKSGNLKFVFRACWGIMFGVKRQFVVA